MNSQNGTNGTPPSCSRAARVKYGMAYGARALGSRSFRSSQRTGKPSTRAQRSQSSPTAKGSRFPDEKKEAGEPDDAKVSRPVRGGAGRKGRNDLARSLPYCQWGA